MLRGRKGDMTKNYCVWTSNDNEHFVSNCGSNYRFISKKETLNFCPFCGAEIKLYGKPLPYIILPIIEKLYPSRKYY